jgi:hypothetical protein
MNDREKTLQTQLNESIAINGKLLGKVKTLEAQVRKLIQASSNL